MNAQAFNARAIFWLRPDRLYRVYSTRGELFFIRIGGQGGDLGAALGALLGPLGSLIEERLRRRREAKLRARVEEVDRIPPEIRAREHRHSFQLSVAQIAESQILEPSRVAAHGRHDGRWTFTLQGGEHWRFQFENLDDMTLALELLHRELGDRLAVTRQDVQAPR
jgi:hypothetical protein